jgi:capsular exopolysaccharide synthesis family protein
MSSFTKKVDLREYLSVLLRRGWLVVVPVIVALGMAYVGSMPRFLPPTYESSSKLLMEFPQPLSRQMREYVDQPSSGEQFDRLSNMTQSSEFLKTVIRQAKLESDPSARKWAQANRAKFPSMSEDDLAELYLMRYLRQVIGAGSSRREPNVFTITVRDPFPRRALSICEVITEGVIAASKEQTLEQVGATQEFAAEMVALYREKLGEAERQLREYESGQFRQSLENGIVNGTNLLQAKALLRSAGIQADDATNRRVEQARVVERLGDNPERWLHMIRPPTVEDAIIRHLALVKDLTENELQDLTTELRGGTTDGTTTSLRVQLANRTRDMRSLFSDMIGEAQGGESLSSQLREAVLTLLMRDLDAQVADQRRSFLASEIRTYETKAAQLPDLEMRTQGLRQEVESNEALLNAFMNQIAAAQVQQAFEAQKVGGQLKVLEPASLPLEPISPNRPMILVLAGLGGVFLGVLLIFVVEHHDTTIRDVNQLPDPLRQNVLGSLPVIRDRARKEREYQKAGMKGKTIPLFDYYRDEAPSSFEFRRLVLDLSRNGGEVPKSIMVTSAERGEGKTTTACMLALTLARHRRVRTVLVDLDFRKPQVHHQMGIAKHSPGSAEALMERSLNREAVRPTSEANLFVLPAGSFRAISAESVTPESVRWLIEELQRWFDVIVIDSPPNLAVPDPLVIGQVVESVLFVVKAGSTSRQVITRGFEMQSRARDNLAGVLLNNVRGVMPYYYNYEHYGYVATEPTGPGSISENGR